MKSSHKSQTSSTPLLASSSLLQMIGKHGEESHAVDDNQIRELAYRLYEERARIDGNDLQDWFEAESLLRGQSKLAA
jgi:hypothetical protein